ncbi:MAG TPA: glycosyltransferase family 4 protein [Candidatus Acidoferrales bacterium]|nr:glycosyltransferase family 4 protein [Candidatus Acidoferrales bacterium]
MTSSRILFISQDYSTHARRFLAGLAEAGHAVWFLPCEARNRDHELSSIAASIKHLPPLELSELSCNLTGCLESYKRLRDVVERVRPQLVLAGPLHTGGFLAALAETHPLIVMSWGYDVLSVAKGSEWLDSVTRFTLSQADLVLGDCEAVRNEVCELAGLPRDRVLCFPWGIDLQRFRPDARPIGLRKRFGWRNNRVIVTARSLEPVHGTMQLLEGIEIALRKRCDARVVMLGDGSLRACVEAFIEDRGLRDKIRVIGRVAEEELPGYFVEADLYVSAAPCDGSSISLLEAMGCGLAAIVPDVGGNKEWILPKKNGWRYPLGKSDALAAATNEALGRDEVRRKMGLANVRIVRERADWNHTFRRFLDLCDRLTAICPAAEALSYAQL